MTYKEIIYNIVDRVAIITLNRPDKLNAWTRTMAGEVHRAIFNAADDDGVRVIILTGAGRAFCSGADMSELEAVLDNGLSGLNGSETAEKAVSILTGTNIDEQKGDSNNFDVRFDFNKRYSYLLTIPKPIIAAINGPAAGLGLIMALYCDIRFASDKARITTAFSRRGLIAEHGISWILPRIVGISSATDLLFSARIIDAQEALRINLVNRIFPEEDMMEGVRTYAAELATFVSPRSLKVMKQQIYEAQVQTFAEASVAADKALLSSLKSEDFREGVAHFVEKRKPVFTGH
jgi:enoyl-CoA hydratase/carnithine racemase